MIDSDGSLAGFLPKLQAAEVVALDTEADSLHAYPEKLCLVQISIGDEDWLIDPLAPLDLAPLWTALKRQPLLLHGADYDLRLLRKNHGFVPERIFDTMLASRLLGDREFGLVNLLAKYLGVSLEKGSQKADWAKRPLTPRMEAYARNDTHYLAGLAGILRERLREKGRLGWAEESCARLIAECAIPTEPQPDRVWRVKGSHKLSRAALAVLRELWQWREAGGALAGTSRLSLCWVTRRWWKSRRRRWNNGLMRQWLPRHFSERRQEGLGRAIKAGLARSPQEQPDYLRMKSHRQTEAERRRFDELEERRNRRAAELEIDPTLIASRATLLALASHWDQAAADLMSWQKELLSAPALSAHVTIVKPHFCSQ